MFFDLRRKIMGPVVLRNEIKIGDRSGIEGSKNRIFSGVADRRGGKPAEEVGIVRSGM